VLAAAGLDTDHHSAIEDIFNDRWEYMQGHLRRRGTHWI
jgi:hypothetical protein